MSFSKRGKIEKPTSDANEDDALEGKLEDDQIQCSLPFYLEHLFGQCVGGSTQSQNTTSSLPNEPILNSQGFLVSTKSNTSNTVANAPSLISLSSLPRVEEDGLVAGGGEEDPMVEHSPLLFTSPDHSGTIDHLDTNQSNAQDQWINLQPNIELAIKIDATISDVPCVTKLNTTDDVCNQIANQSNTATVGQSTKCEKTKRGRKRKLSRGGDEYTCPPRATALKDCSGKQGTVFVLALVVQVNPVMDVSCRVGNKAGQTVPMSSLLLADPTKSYFKLSLWRQAAVWVERISAGDVIYFRRIRLKTWRGEVVGTTTMFSSVLNLHQPKKSLPPQVSSEIPEESLDCLVRWAHKFFGYLFQGSVPKSRRIVEFVSSDQLSNHSLVHFRARLLSMVTDKVLVLSDVPDKEFCLYLVGVDSSLWSPQLRGGLGRVWEFTYLTSSPDTLTQGGCTLHATSRSQLRVLDKDCQVSMDILKLFPLEGDCGTGLVTKGMSISDVLLGKSSGVYQLKARAERVEFIDGASLSLESVCDLSPSSLVQELFQSCIYVGCGSCSNFLSQDENGVYRQCMPCLLSRATKLSLLLQDACCDIEGRLRVQCSHGNTRRQSKSDWYQANRDSAHKLVQE
ncbi:shieldin complex subunit 2-like isoform X3 [Halichondria panicea]|uniref:shieldin complex subunit 2-like isoform X3 n=1 Tax=Halichondria panicea TaxID=6063 RepID=UPI00312B905D